MVASCHRRSGDYAAALEKYKWIHQHFPDDTDCKTISTHTSKFRLFRLGIQFLVKIATDLHLPERETYEAELKKVNKLKEVEQQVWRTFKKRF